MRVRVGLLTSLSNTNPLNVRAPTPYTHSIIRVTCTRASLTKATPYIYILKCPYYYHLAVKKWRYEGNFIPPCLLHNALKIYTQTYQVYLFLLYLVI